MPQTLAENHLADRRYVSAVSIAASPGRFGFGPQLTLFYGAVSGNGTFGLG